MATALGASAAAVLDAVKRREAKVPDGGEEPSDERHSGRSAHGSARVGRVGVWLVGVWLVGAVRGRGRVRCFRSVSVGAIIFFFTVSIPEVVVLASCWPP